MGKMESFEPRPGEEGRLSEGEAHDEANMLRAHLKASPELGGRVEENYLSDERIPEHEFTAENYDEALTQIEKWRETVKSTPNGKRALIQILEHVNPLSGGYGVLLAAEAMNAVFEGGAEGKMDGIGIVEGIKRNWREKSETDLQAGSVDRIFSSAESRLRVLQRRGKKFGDREIQNGVKE